MIDRLKEGINLRGYAQLDPVVEYKKEAFNAFGVLNNQIKMDAIEKLLKVQIVDPEQAQAMESMMKGPDLDDLQFHGADEASAGGAVNMQRQQTPAGKEALQEEMPPGRQRVRMGPPQAQQQQKVMNREERRRMERGKR